MDALAFLRILLKKRQGYRWSDGRKWLLMRKPEKNAKYEEKLTKMFEC